MQVIARMTSRVRPENDTRMDKVFKARADDTRRRLLDRLHENNGQTLGELCERIAMTRRSVTQHLAVLIDEFERPRLAGAVKRRAEEAMTDKPGFAYVTCMASTPEKVWEALTDADLTAAYRGHSNVSDWRPGSRWEHVRTDGSGVADVVGRVVVSEPPTRLVTIWAAPGREGREEGHSRVTFEIRPEDIVRLTVVHEDLADEDERADVASGRPCCPTSGPCWRPAGPCPGSRGWCRPR